MRRPSLLLSGLAIALLFAACGGSSGSGGDASGGGDTSTPATQPPADTGRMSPTEWESARDSMRKLNGEIADYRGRIAERCLLILQGGEIANTLDCVDKAFEGVEGQAGVTFQTLDDLKDDTGGKCRASVVRAANIANVPLFRALRSSKAAFASLNVDAITPAVKNLNAQDSRWRDAEGDLLQLCAPS